MWREKDFSTCYGLFEFCIQSHSLGVEWDSVQNEPFKQRTYIEQERNTKILFQVSRRDMASSHSLFPANATEHIEGRSGNDILESVGILSNEMSGTPESFSNVQAHFTLCINNKMLTRVPQLKLNQKADNLDVKHVEDQKKSAY
nr:uncharacterized protein LOC131779179 [Pocillopora verrucosa]